MRIKAQPLVVLSIAILLPIIVACGNTTSPSSTDIRATAMPLAPTTIPQNDIDTANLFNTDQASISSEWADFHTDFDQWRTGLISCDRSSLVTSLRDFSGDFSPIAQQAHNLPRSAVARGLSDKLIEGASNEEASLRQLRDQWQSGDTSLFAALDASRSSALSIQKEVADELLDLREANGDDEADEGNAEFSEAFEKITGDWEQFHEEYAALRDDLDNLTTGEISAQLSALVDSGSTASATARAGQVEYISERLRLLYVAITRARRYLSISFSQHVPAGQRTRRVPDAMVFHRLRTLRDARQGGG